ncbi:MAG: cytochrome c [Pseudomonadota bacterium]|nr:cytochrome c [Pseudomonadota bacterium]
MRALFSFLLAFAIAPAFADEAKLQLKPGPGLDQLVNNCGACHSLDYVVMNSGFLNEKGWDGEVNKMIKVFGANIDEADAKAIKSYLSTNYGK